jgi:ABC-2 type transport system permease protein
MGNALIMLAVLAVVAGTAATAGEEGAGTLDLVLAQPVRRTRVMLAKTAGIAAGLALSALAAIPGYLLAILFVDGMFSTWRFVAAILALLPAVALFLALSLLAGATFKSRGMAATAAAGAIVGAYFLNAIGGSIEFLEGSRRLSPFYWSDTAHVLLHGFDWARAVGLLAAAGILLAGAAFAFQRREIASAAPAGGLRVGRRRARRLSAGGAASPPWPGGALASRAGLVLEAMHAVRMGALGAAAAAFIIALLDVLLFPTYHEALVDFEYPDALKGMLGEAGSIASAEGFLTAQFFSIVPLVLIILAVLAGTSATAGDEAAGRLDVLLAQPASRTRVLLSKAAGIVLALFAATLASVPGFLLGGLFADLDLSAWNFLAAVANVLSLVFLFVAVALWAGAALPDRASAATLAGGMVVAAFLLNMLGAVSNVFDAARRVSPFWWADASHALLGGFDPLRTGASVAAGAVFLALAAWAFEGRDIGGGRRNWRLSWPRPGGRRETGRPPARRVPA